MATIIRKMKGGKAYFYLAESARVEGKPRIVRQVYLGKAEDVAARLEARQPLKPLRARVLEFGASAAAAAIAEEIGVAEIIDEVAPKRDQGLSVGDYITLAAVNRVVAPCSKRRFAAWYGGCALSKRVKRAGKDLAPQRFWDAMGRLGEREIALAEERIASSIIERYRLDTSALVIDATNFFTFIDSSTPGELARRGHSKQKRHDLRQIGLALLVSKDHGVPLASLCYPGNVADCKSFSSLADEIVERYKTFASGVEDITVVFDKGNNSASNFAALDASSYHFVGSLVPTRHKELLSVPLSRFRTAPGIEGVSTCRATKEVFGVTRTLVVTFSEELFAKQRRGLSQTLSKACRQLSELSALLERGRVRRSEEEISREIDRVLEPRWMREIVSARLEKGPSGLRLEWMIDEDALDEVERTHFGKRVLFTDRDDLTDSEIVTFYRTQSVVENAFRQMKDPAFISFSPMFHWTDGKIRVHVFYCVIALMITNLMWRKVRSAGIEISPKAMVSELAGVTLIDCVYPASGGKGRPRVRTTHSELSGLQRKLLTALGLDGLLPRQG